ncbi:response regulator [Desulfopila sp. IMCC35006]|uniref:PAS domain-containing hybrid sensor histidine kinase/response regulator n=1 Tax=Desulfopila sp. IMCC35006 TaxID=2569542 RepID=UPI0010AB76E0|nr:PAS domain-containing sensor histidine kinase [Desulfopila sp. IMCC35006]TKB23325.1 response regulator [Desulfopila sp. IMCC35006]
MPRINYHPKVVPDFLESIGAATIIFTSDAVVSACNRSAEKLLGLPAGGLVGCTLAELELELVDAKGKPLPRELFPVNKLPRDNLDNVQFDFGLRLPLMERTEWLRGIVKPYHADDGELAGLVLSLSVITDIIGEKNTQSQIYLAKKEWEATVDALPDIVTIQDLEMRIVRANKVAHDLFGYALGALKGRTCYEVFHRRTTPCENCPLLQSREKPRFQVGTIYNEILDKTFTVSSFPIFDQQGKLCQLVQVARDVSREKMMEQQLQQRMKMEALGTLAGGIAHDFNNILAAMIGYGEIARGRLAPDHPARKDLDQVIAGGDRAVDLVKRILTFSRKESDGQFRPVKIQYVVEEVIKLLTPSLPATIELLHEIDPSCRSILADSGQMHQVLMNLCTNARQAIGDGHGRITIRLSEIEDVGQIVSHAPLARGTGVLLDLEVSDTGCGIAKDKLDKIFDPFFTTKRKEHGTGLGLAVVHGIIAKHQGAIQVASQVGVGTTFHVYLNIDGGEEPGRPAKKIGELGGNERIMVIDDEIGLTDLLRELLQEKGYVVTTFSDSIAAVRAFRQDPNCCDLVITDMLMPGMTGAELAREFLGQRPDIPIIMVTGHSGNFDKKRATLSGIRELLVKPVKKEKLYQIVRKVLNHG